MPYLCLEPSCSLPAAPMRCASSGLWSRIPRRLLSSLALAGRKGRGENVGMWDRHHRPLSLLHLLSHLLLRAIKRSPNCFFLSLATRLSSAGCMHGAELQPWYPPRLCSPLRSINPQTRLLLRPPSHAALLSAHWENDSSRFQLGRGGASPCCAAATAAPQLFWGCYRPCCRAVEVVVAPSTCPTPPRARENGGSTAPVPPGSQTHPCRASLWQ